LAYTETIRKIGTETFSRQRFHKWNRHLHKQAAAIARFPIGGNSAPVRHAGKRFYSGLQQPVTRVTSGVCY
jgi:hypothetical protein